MNYRQSRLMLAWLHGLQDLQAGQGTQALQKNTAALGAMLLRGALPPGMQELRYDLALAAEMRTVAQALAACTDAPAAQALLRDACARTEAEMPELQYRCFGACADRAGGQAPERPDIVVYAGCGLCPGDVPDGWEPAQAERSTPYTVFVEDAQRPLTERDCGEPFFYHIWKLIGHGAALRERMVRFGYCDAQNVVLTEEVGAAPLREALPAYLRKEMDADLTARAAQICAACSEEEN